MSAWVFSEYAHRQKSLNRVQKFLETRHFRWIVFEVSQMLMLLEVLDSWCAQFGIDADTRNLIGSLVSLDTGSWFPTRMSQTIVICHTRYSSWKFEYGFSLKSMVLVIEVIGVFVPKPLLYLRTFRLVAAFHNHPRRSTCAVAFGGTSMDWCTRSNSSSSSSAPQWPCIETRRMGVVDTIR